jgi:hypothetical protein
MAYFQKVLKTSYLLTDINAGVIHIDALFPEFHET